MTELTEQNPRHDFEIYNESLALIISNAGLKEHYEDTPQGHLRAIENRDLIAVELDQDDGFIARVVFGNLSSKERSEWIGRSSRRLNLPDGKLVIAGGVSYISEEMDDEYYEIIDVPKGEYFVTIYHQLPSVNGLRLTEFSQWEGFVSYFRSTRSKTRRLPDWLAEFAAIAEEDLEADESEDDDIEPIAFVIQIKPVGPRQAESKLEKDYGFVSTELRLPKKCPLGIEPVGIERSETIIETEEEFQARMEAERLEQEKRYDDRYELARKFGGVPRFIKVGKFEEIVSYFVPELQADVAAYVENEAKKLHQKAGIDPGPPWIEAGFNEMWRDNEPFKQTIARWKSVNQDQGNLLFADAVTEENYQGEVRCEFQDAVLYQQGISKMYVMMDLLVVETAVGPKAAGISFY